ncbi:Diacylglycerol kinase [compost metagenome]
MMKDSDSTGRLAAAKDSGLAAQAVDARRDEYKLAVSISGEGTLYEVINGLDGQPHLPKLGIVPLGTVNDFARPAQLTLTLQVYCCCASLRA